MKDLALLMKWDVLLLYRNRLFHIAIIIAIIYTGLFFLLKPLGDLTKVLIILIYNDPVVTGYIFGGIIWLFDKNQHTLQAVSVLPVKFEKYILSKIIILSLLAVLVSLVMAISTTGLDFNVLQMAITVFLSSFIFSAVGFTAASISRGFNDFLFYTIPIMIISSIPFLSLFGIGRIWYYILIPTASSVELLSTSFSGGLIKISLIMYVHLLIWTIIIWRMTVRITKNRVI